MLLLLQMPFWSRSLRLPRFSEVVSSTTSIGVHMIADIFGLRPTVVCMLLLVFAFASAGGAQVAVTTWHYDNARTGANPSETILTPPTSVPIALQRCGETTLLAESMAASSRWGNACRENGAAGDVSPNRTASPAVRSLTPDNPLS